MDGEEEWVDEGTVPEHALEAFERVRACLMQMMLSMTMTIAVTIAIVVTMTNVFRVAHE